MHSNTVIYSFYAIQNQIYIYTYREKDTQSQILITFHSKVTQHPNILKFHYY